MQLKQEMSAATTSGESATDEAMAAEANDLFHELRDWAMNTIKTTNLGKSLQHSMYYLINSYR